MLAGGILLLLWGLLDLSSLPRTSFFGGRRLAEKWVGLEAQERGGALDVLAIGASQIDQGFDAQRFGEVAGLRAFNLGVAGTDFYLQSILARALLLTGRRPRIVLWGSLDSTQWQTGINYQYVNAPAATLVGGPLAGTAFQLGMHLPQFHRRRLLEWITLGLPDAAGEVERVDEFGRFHLAEASTGAVEPTAAAETQEDRANRFDYGADLAQVRAHVEETLRLLQVEGIQVWFVLTPYEQSLFERDSAHAWRMLVGPADGHFEWLRHVVRQFNLELVDLHYCPEISADPTLFHDPTHLNGAGSLRLGALLGDLVSGRRPIPADWRDLPSQAQRKAIFEHEPPETPALLPLGQAHRLADTPDYFPTGSPIDVYARVEVEEPGDYRLVFEPPETLERFGAFYVRIGTGNYRCWRANGVRNGRALEWRLTSGMHVLELHALPSQTIDWGVMKLEPVPGQEPGQEGLRPTPSR